MGSSASCTSSSSSSSTLTSSSKSSISSPLSSLPTPPSSTSSSKSSSSSLSLTIQYILLYTLLPNELAKLIDSFIPRCIYRFCSSNFDEHILIQSITMLNMDVLVQYGIDTSSLKESSSTAVVVENNCSSFVSCSHFQPWLRTMGELKPIPTYRLAASTTIIDHRYIFVTGGNTGNFGCSTLSTVECFDIISGNWSSKAPMIEARQNHCTAAIDATTSTTRVGGSQLFAFGGCSFESGSKFKYFKTAEVYNVSTDTWSPLPCMHLARQHAMAVSYNNRLYVFGGTWVSEGEYYPAWKSVSSCECFDITSSTWHMSEE